MGFTLLIVVVGILPADGQTAFYLAAEGIGNNRGQGEVRFIDCRSEFSAVVRSFRFTGIMFYGQSQIDRRSEFDLTE